MFIVVQQQTEISIGGGELPLLWRLVLILLAMLVLGLIVWLFRRLRRSIQAEDEWYTGEYSLLKPEAPASSPGVDTAARSPVSPSTELPAAATVTLKEPSPLLQQPDSIPSAPLIEERTPVLSPSLFKEPSPEARPPAPATESAGASSSLTPPTAAEPEYPAAERMDSDMGQRPLSADAARPTASEVTPPQQPDAAVLPPASQPTPSPRVLGIPSGQAELPHPTATLDVVQEITWHPPSLVINMRVRNASTYTLSNLFAEFALVPIGVDLVETRLEPIEPNVIGPGQQGKLLLELKANRYSLCKLTRIITADKKEVSFSCWLALPPQPTEPPSR
ncbi:MAG: hypothetical protein RMM98_10410 [Acidobacteriota bacterium]|nr:hypothetical protein [Blastocatellia bacterium]MDW8240018.1 hypothetical protein [Acidobacteriota bacterium]